MCKGFHACQITSPQKSTRLKIMTMTCYQTRSFTSNYCELAFFTKTHCRLSIFLVQFLWCIPSICKIKNGIYLLERKMTFPKFLYCLQFLHVCKNWISHYPTIWPLPHTCQPANNIWWKQLVLNFIQKIRETSRNYSNLAWSRDRFVISLYFQNFLNIFFSWVWKL